MTPYLEAQKIRRSRARQQEERQAERLEVLERRLRREPLVKGTVQFDIEKAFSPEERSQLYKFTLRAMHEAPINYAVRVDPRDLELIRGGDRDEWFKRFALYVCEALYQGMGEHWHSDILAAKRKLVEYLGIDPESAIAREVSLHPRY